MRERGEWTVNRQLELKRCIFFFRLDGNTGRAASLPLIITVAFSGHILLNETLDGSGGAEELRLEDQSRTKSKYRCSC